MDQTASGGTVVTTAYTFDNLNELLNSTQTGGDGPGTTTYGYDLNGNRISKTDPAGTQTAYRFDVSDRLIEADQGGSPIFTAAYDAVTQRLSTTQNGTTTLFRYDGGQNFQEVQAGAVVTELIRAGGQGGGIGSVLYSDKSMDATPGPVEFFTYDAVGNTVALTDAAGTPTQTTLYNAFGGMVVQTGASANDRLHNTKERDASTGLDNYGMRYYDSGSGTFITRDPSGYKDGLNVYQSVHDDPLNGIDPTGLGIVSTFVTGGGNHFNPLYLGGSNSQPVGYLSQSEHMEFHQAFENKGLGWMGGNGPSARANWGAMGDVERVNQIVNAADRAGLTSEQMTALEDHMPQIMAGGTPGEKTLRTAEMGEKMWNSSDEEASKLFSEMNTSAEASTQLGGLEKELGAASDSVGALDRELGATPETIVPPSELAPAPASATPAAPAEPEEGILGSIGKELEADATEVGAEIEAVGHSSSNLTRGVGVTTKVVGVLGMIPGLVEDVHTLINSFKDGKSFSNEMKDQYQDRGNIIMGPGFLMPNPWQGNSSTDPNMRA